MSKSISRETPKTRRQKCSITSLQNAHSQYDVDSDQTDAAGAGLPADGEPRCPERHLAEQRVESATAQRRQIVSDIDRDRADGDKEALVGLGRQTYLDVRQVRIEAELPRVDAFGRESRLQEALLADLRNVHA